MIERLRFTIEPRKPYSLGLTVEHFGRYPEVVDVVVQGVYRRLLPVGGALLLLSVTVRTPSPKVEPTLLNMNKPSPP